MNWLDTILQGVLLGGLYALFAAGLSIPQLFLVTALMNAAVAVFIYGLVPEFLMRFLAWLLIHSVYRLEKRGLEHIPDEGGAVIVTGTCLQLDVGKLAHR